MNVPKLPFLEKKKNNSEFFLSLVLRDEKVSAVIFEELNGRINVVGEHEEHFKTSLEDGADEELLNVLDRAVSTAERNLPEGMESHKTIFGVKRDWIEDEKIKKEYLIKLKKISDELDFKPVGFLVIPEAIAHLLHKEEGAPVSAILVEVGQKNTTVSLFKAGKIVETKSAPIADSLPNTVESLLKHFTTSEILPSRIILFDGGKEKLQQEFISHKWSKDLPFLHVPQVMNLPANFDARAVLNGAATQMGFEVLEGSLTTATKQDKEPVIDALGAAVGEDEDKTLAQAASEFGFSEGDVKKGQPQQEQTIEEAAAESVAKQPKTAVDESLTNFREIPEEVKIASSDKRELGINAAALGTSMRGFMGKLHLGSFIRSASGNRKLAAIIGIPTAFLILIFIVYLFLRSATVTLGINGKQTEKEESITFSQTSSTKPADNVIAAQFIKVEEDGKITTSATGKKETGDKAKGTVTIFNNSSEGITLAAGTTISGSDLNFLTDKAVTVASASGDIFSGTSPGKANVAVTAEKFGTNYNLPSNTKFSVSGKTDVAAKNDNAFSGGTKKELKVVSQKDLDKLLKDLQKDKEDEAKGDIAKKAEGDVKVLPSFLSVAFSKKSFSKDVGDESDEVSLTATIEFSGISYKKEDMQAFAKDKLKDSENKLDVDVDSVEVSAQNLKAKGDSATSRLTIKAKLIPQLNQKELADQIKGKSTGDATQILNQIDEVNRVNINVFPPIPFLPDRLPFSSGKIKFVVEKNG